MSASIQCNWHLGDLDALDAELAMDQIRDLKEHAAPIDLSKDEAELHEELGDLLRVEGQYWERSHDLDGSALECQIKWSPDHVLCGGSKLSCFHCPMHTESGMEPRSLICKIGRRQEEISGQLAALRVADSLDAEMAAAFARDFEIADEVEAELAYVAA